MRQSSEIGGTQTVNVQASSMDPKQKESDQFSPESIWERSATWVSHVDLKQINLWTDVDAVKSLRLDKLKAKDMIFYIQVIGQIKEVEETLEEQYDDVWLQVRNASLQWKNQMWSQIESWEQEFYQSVIDDSPTLPHNPHCCTPYEAAIVAIMWSHGKKLDERNLFHMIYKKICLLELWIVAKGGKRRMKRKERYNHIKFYSEDKIIAIQKLREIQRVVEMEEDEYLISIEIFQRYREIYQDIIRQIDMEKKKYQFQKEEKERSEQEDILKKLIIKYIREQKFGKQYKI